MRKVLTGLAVLDIPRAGRTVGAGNASAFPRYTGPSNGKAYRALHFHR